MCHRLQKHSAVLEIERRRLALIDEAERQAVGSLHERTESEQSSRPLKHHCVRKLCLQAANARREKKSKRCGTVGPENRQMQDLGNYS